MKRAKLNPNEVIRIETEFQLVLHDYGNLAVQVVATQATREGLDGIAENLNNAFAQAGSLGQFKAEVNQIETPIERWQVDGRFSK